MVLLSFDIEEFDMPQEYGKTISFDEQIRISYEGTWNILCLLERYNIRATFFCTATFALSKPELIKEMVACGHEVASHGFYHSQFHVEDLAASKIVLEKITRQPVNGYRMARMMPVDNQEIKLAGYGYNSSLNPTWIPGRYNNWKSPRQLFNDNDLLQLPASVSPTFRIPLFWLSFHNFPLWIYKYLCRKTYAKDKYLNLYYHPWEFTDLRNKELGMPGFVSRNSGTEMISRMESLINYLRSKKMVFGTIGEFLNTRTLQPVN